MMIISTFIPSFFLIASHLFIIPSIWWTWKRRRQLWIEFAILTCIFLWSTSYHVCYQTDVCFFEKILHRESDHYFAQLSVPLTLFYVGCVDKVYIKGLFYILITQIDYILIALYGPGTLPKIFMITSTFILVFLYLFIRKCFYGKKMFRHFDITDGLFGILLGIFGTLFFTFDPMSSDNYYVGHSIWHCLSFLGSYFVFESRNPDKMLCIPISTWKYWDGYLRRKWLK